jgi:hypothetical protein
VAARRVFAQGSAVIRHALLLVLVLVLVLLPC